MTDFVNFVARIARELRRSNVDEQIKDAVNDAILEASSTRFYFNEMVGVTFDTVIGQEYYPDLALTDVDIMYYFQGVTKRRVYEISNTLANARAIGTTLSGQLLDFSRVGTTLRLYPIPSAVFTLTMDGYGRLTPSPLVNDVDTNDWLTEGERYIRALAKRNVLRDVLRDYGEATALDAMAADYRTDLLDATTQRIGTGVLSPTDF